ncbi:lysosome-associated membrane glycoprotein 5 isoform X2 [Nerophis ophidion]|uniref:lysosome-associated membrane glycoprotein 5 isoform X2 n=1 Tax=Nerophis ophidion TaxID=159077 RepID=UPI002ADF1A64|nr:lysosome-associated membrane glycoprotein 5 isoform X2 [Nerophis ophidion]
MQAHFCCDAVGGGSGGGWRGAKGGVGVSRQASLPFKQNLQHELHLPEETLRRLLVTCTPNRHFGLGTTFSGPVQVFLLPDLCGGICPPTLSLPLSLPPPPLSPPAPLSPAALRWIHSLLLRSSSRGRVLKMRRAGFSTTDSCRLLLLMGVLVLAEQEGENLSGLSTNPDQGIFAVRENGTTCLMVEFAVKFLVPYDVLALNRIDDIRDRGEVWKINKVQFAYDTSETTHFINAYNPGKYTANTHRLSALVTPAGHSYVCTAQQTLTLISSDHQKGVTVAMYDIQIQPFDMTSDFVFSEPYKCITDQRERLEETLPLILGLVLALIIVITLTVYHFHLKLTAASQPQLPRDRSMYKNM